MNPYDAEDQVLRTLMGDASADKVKRAAAFEANHPGITARIGQAGELSFSNVPGRDVYGPYLKATAQTSPEGREAVQELLHADSGANLDQKAAALDALAPPGTTTIVTDDGQLGVVAVKPANIFVKPATADELFKQQYTEMAKLTTVEDLTVAKAQIIQANQDWTVTKFESLKQRAYAAHGVAALQTEVETQRMLDRRAYAQYGDGVDRGDTDETKDVLRKLESAIAKADAEAANALQKDPEVAGLAARMQAVDALYSSRVTTQLSMEAEALKTSATGGKAAGSDLGSLLQPEQELAYKVAAGISPDQEIDPATRQELTKQLVVGGGGNLTVAMEVGLESDGGKILANSMQSGTIGLYGKNVLRAKLGGDTELEAQLKKAAAARLAEAAAGPVGPDGKPRKVDTRSPAQQKADLEEAQRLAFIQARQDVKVLRDMGWEASIPDWQLPQDPTLQGEVKGIIEVMKAERATRLKEDPKYNPANDPTQNFQGLVARLDLKQPDSERLDTVKIRKLADWYQSQANLAPGNDYFGLPAGADMQDAYGKVEAFAALQQAKDTGLWGQYIKPAFGQAIKPWLGVAGTYYNVFKSGLESTDQLLFGTGLPLGEEEVPAPSGYLHDINPARVDPNYEMITDYYRGRAGVDPEWIAERERNLAAARKGE